MFAFLKANFNLDLFLPRKQIPSKEKKLGRKYFPRLEHLEERTLLAADSLGTDFWLTFMQNAKTPSDLDLFITGPNNTTATVDIPGLSFSQVVPITANNVATVVVPVTAIVANSDLVENKGIHVTALAEVSVYGMNHAEPTSDAFLGLPTDILGTDYINLGYNNTADSGNGNGTEFAIVATVNNTTVTITPSITTNGHTAGVPYTKTMNQGETYFLQDTGPTGNDLTGTFITSSHPIALFGGHKRTMLPTASYSAGNHLVEELPPTNTWGKNFVTVPLATRIGGDTFRMLASTNNTQVTVNGTVVATLNRGQFWQQLIDGPAEIRANNPILVAQYSNSQSFDKSKIADPFMMLIPPAEQFLGDYTVTTPANVDFPVNYINLAVPDTALADITINGAPLASVTGATFLPIGATGFTGVQVAVDAGSYHLAGPQAFGVFVYAYARIDGYGYPGGLSLSSIALVNSLTLTPPTDSQSVGNLETLTTTVRDLFNRPLKDIRVDFTVTGINPKTSFAFTDANGQAIISWTSTKAGSDSVKASIGSLTDTSQVTWTTGITITPNTLNLTEGSPGKTYTVGLLSQPSANVTIKLQPDNQVTVSTPSLVFTPTSWSAKTVTVTAVDDSVVEGPHTGITTQTVTSNDAAFNGLIITSVTASITDNDLPGVTITQTAGSTVTFRGDTTDSYTVRLQSPPSANVTITLTPGPQLTLSTTSLVFTSANWNVPQEITVATPGTGTYIGPGTSNITQTASSGDSFYNGIGINDVPVTILDGTGYVITGTTGNDSIQVNPSADLSQLLVSVNGVITFVPATVPQLILDTGNGNDTIQINSPTIPVLVDSGLGIDSLTVLGQASSSNSFTLGTLTLAVNASTISMYGLENLTVNGQAQNDAFTVQSTPDPSIKSVILNGGLGLDTLVGPNLTNTWKITGSNAGLLNKITQFAGIENLTGGSGYDTFTFNPGKNVTGQINGAGSNDVLDYSLFTTPLTFNLQTGSATGISGGVQNIETIFGSKSTNDKIIGPNTASTWNITDRNAGNVAGVFFQGIENLTGGSGDDTFRFAADKTVTGKIDAGLGTDSLDYSSYTTPINLNLQLKKATAVTGGIANFESVIGGSATSNILTAANKANTWTITGNNAGIIFDGTTTFTFSAMANLVGGSAADTFNATNPWTEKLDGGLGMDTLVGNNTNHSWNITASNAGTFDGHIFNGIENLQGGSGTDTFAFNTGKSITGKIDGGAGSDILDYSAFTTSVFVNLGTGKATGLAGFQNLEQFLGGLNSNNTLTGSNFDNTWNLSGANVGNFTNSSSTFNFSNFANLTGGNQGDSFTLAAAGAWTGYLQGGLGIDSLTAFNGKTNIYTSSTLNGSRFGSIESYQ